MALQVIVSGVEGRRVCILLNTTLVRGVAVVVETDTGANEQLFWDQVSNLAMIVDRPITHEWQRRNANTPRPKPGGVVATNEVGGSAVPTRQRPPFDDASASADPPGQGRPAPR